MQPWCKRIVVLALAGVIPLATSAAVQAEGWGTIKGQVVWHDKEAPKRAPIKPDKDPVECEKNGKLFDDKLVVNPKNKGVRWCLVYLMDVKGFNKEIPIHPKLKEIKDKTAVIDQPCCQFEPHILVMRQGQTLIAKNSAKISHNVNIVGAGPWTGINPIVPARGSVKVEDIPARYIPYMVKCDIHRWMSARIAVMKHPYFAVTDEDGKFEIKDAPAGEFRLVIWHEEGGWVIGDEQPNKQGKKITIKDKETTDLGKIPMQQAKD